MINEVHFEIASAAFLALLFLLTYSKDSFLLKK